MRRFSACCSGGDTESSAATMAVLSMAKRRVSGDSKCRYTKYDARRSYRGRFGTVKVYMLRRESNSAPHDLFIRSSPE